MDMEFAGRENVAAVTATAAAAGTLVESDASAGLAAAACAPTIILDTLMMVEMVFNGWSRVCYEELNSGHRRVESCKAAKAKERKPKSSWRQAKVKSKVKGLASIESVIQIQVGSTSKWRTMTYKSINTLIDPTGVPLSWYHFLHFCYQRYKNVGGDDPRQLCGCCICWC